MSVATIRMKSKSCRSVTRCEFDLDSDFIRHLPRNFSGEAQCAATKASTTTIDGNLARSLPPTGTGENQPLIGIHGTDGQPPAHRNRIGFYEQWFQGIHSNGKAEIFGLQRFQG